jgi:hypothetical protein
LSGADLVVAAASDLLRGTAPPVVAAQFHNGVSDMVVATCRRLRAWTGVATVALSGGAFQNLLLLRRTVDHLAAGGFRVLTHSRVPTNDGGISLGQVAVAVAVARAGAEPGRSRLRAARLSPARGCTGCPDGPLVLTLLPGPIFVDEDGRSWPQQPRRYRLGGATKGAGGVLRTPVVLSRSRRCEHG